MAAPAVELRSISRRFGGVQALRGVTLAAEVGEVHAVVGENGAGKSTLMNVLAGAIAPDQGEVRREGRAIALGSPAASKAAGISVVYQELTLMPELSVEENIAAAALPVTWRRTVDRRTRGLRVRDALNRLGADLDPKAAAGALSLPQQQLVEIARALYTGGAILVLDEPNSALSGRETETMLETVRSLARKGMTVLFVSHRLEEVFTVADKVTVLRDGSSQGTRRASETDIQSVIAAMVGDTRLNERRPRARGVSSSDTVLALRGMRAQRFGPVDLQVHRGEIVGLAGLQGSGTDVALRIAAGAIRGHGTIEVDGRAVRIRHPGDAIESGIVYLPPDRKTEGLWLDYSVERNIGAGGLRRISRAGFFSRRDMRRHAAERVAQLAVRTPSTGLVAGALSGGNQQRVLMARCLELEPRALLLSDPTRGVDVGAKADLHDLIRGLADQGVAVCIVSSELEEIIELADRIVCMRGGQVVGDGAAGTFDKAALLKMIALRQVA